VETRDSQQIVVALAISLSIHHVVANDDNSSHQAFHQWRMEMIVM